MIHIEEMIGDRITRLKMMLTFLEVNFLISDKTASSIYTAKKVS